MSWYAICIIFTVISAVGTALGVRHFLHMFQLNSYKPKVQRQWMKKNNRQLARIILPLVGGFFFWPKQAKKPLHYTPRVKRMIVTICVLSCLWYLFAWRLRFDIFFALVWQWNAPSLVLLANWINSPIEQAIRKHYTKEATAKLRSHPNLIVIGITGSYGKTSVKHYLNTLLRAKYNVLMTPGGVNTPMGVVRVVREELTAAHEVFICEMGAKNVGDIKELCDLVHPKFGVLTSIGPQHLESFLSIENVISTKFELADALPPDGMLFANGDNAYIKGNLANYPNVTVYGAGKSCDYCAENIEVSERGTAFTVTMPDGETERFSTRLVGGHNVQNLTAAIAVAHFMNVPPAQLKGQVRKIAPVQHRLELIDRGGTLILDDAYNSNPAGAKAALDVLALLEGQRILVTPGMIELGAEQEPRNRAFGAQAAAVCDVIALVGAAQTRPIYEGALEAGFPKERLIVANNLQEAMAQVYALPSATRKVILLENDLPDNF